LKVSGWLGANYRAYFDTALAKLHAAGLQDEIEHVDCPTHADKMRFMQSLDVLSVPTTYREPKGIYILEALSNGIPVVQPEHGAFPELLEATAGGLLVEPNNPQALADGLVRLLLDVERRRTIAEHAPQAIQSRFSATVMAQATATVLHQYHQQRPPTS
jgi:glycosyltransferase involved in cell wall biosynthesis